MAKLFFLGFWFIAVIACIAALVLFAVYRGCMTLFYILFVICGMAIGIYIGEQHGGGMITILAGTIGGYISYGLLFVLLTVVYGVIFCPFPYRKKCELRTCHPHYYNWMQFEKDIWYRECYVCHQEYVLFCFKYEMTVNADGTLQPYLKHTRNPYFKYTKWGWEKDKGIDSEILDLVTPEIINQMREKWKEQQSSFHTMFPPLKDCS